MSITAATTSPATPSGRSGRILDLIARASLVAVLATAAYLGLSASTGPNSQLEVREYLARTKLATAAELSRLEAGDVVATVDDGSTSNEVFVVAAVKIRAPRAQVTSYYGQMISYVDGQVTLAFGRLGSPPTLSDVSQLSFDRGEVEDLKACRPRKCAIRLGGAGLDALQSSIDWNAPDYIERVNAFARKAAVQYMAAYQTRGDAALVTYNDRAQPVSLREQWLDLLGHSPHFHQYLPELRAYLQQFPNGTLPGGRDIFYWVKEDYGLEPVISIVHGVIYEPPTQTDRTIVVQKQLYASHYFDASLAVATLLDTQWSGQPATYLLYANRSRGDLLKGGFGGLKRSVARSQARRAAEETLGTIKRVMESGPAASTAGSKAVQRSGVLRVLFLGSYSLTT